MYTWHVTFGEMPCVGDLAAHVQARLAGLPGLDLVPGRWLHLTTQGVGFTDEVVSADVVAIVDAARRRLADVEPPQVTIGPARVASEGVAFGVSPRDGLTVLRDGLRAAVAEIWSPARVPESDDWTPHVSVAYSRVSGPAGMYEAALAGEDAAVSVTIGSVQLIMLGRDRHVYEWDTQAEVRLAPARQA